MSTLDDLLRELRAHPEWRDELRRELLPDELLAMPATLAAMAAAQTRTDERLATLIERMDALTGRVDALVRVVEGVVVEMRRVSDRTDRALGGIVELRCQRRPYAYFSSIATRLKLLEVDALEDILEPAVAEARISEVDALEVRRADGVFKGRSEGRELYLVMEASAVVDEQDVRRATARAAVLRQAGLDVLAVAAGEELDRHIGDLAANAGVWLVTDGRVVRPTEATA